MSGDSFGCPTWGREMYWCAVARDNAKYPTVHKTAPQDNRTSLAQMSGVPSL